jgi:hypothetical protein
MSDREHGEKKVKSTKVPDPEVPERAARRRRRGGAGSAPGHSVEPLPGSPGEGLPNAPGVRTPAATREEAGDLLHQDASPGPYASLGFSRKAEKNPG